MPPKLSRFSLHYLLYPLVAASFLGAGMVLEFGLDVMHQTTYVDGIMHGVACSGILSNPNAATTQKLACLQILEAAKSAYID